jgi:hypothetical protein
MRMQSDGARAAGTVGSDGRTVELRVVDETVFFEADHDIWVDAANAEAADLLADKRVKGSVSDPGFSDFSEFVDKDDFLDELLDRDGDGTLTRVKGRTVDGQQTVGLREKGTDDPGTLSSLTRTSPTRCSSSRRTRPRVRRSSPSGTSR